MSLHDELTRIKTIFIDTAPIIYFIEAHPLFGLLVKEVVDSFQSGKLTAYAGADVFLTNDKKLKQIRGISTLVLADYL